MRPGGDEVGERRGCSDCVVLDEHEHAAPVFDAARCPLTCCTWPTSVLSAGSCWCSPATPALEGPPRCPRRPRGSSVHRAVRRLTVDAGEPQPGTWVMDRPTPTAARTVLLAHPASWGRIDRPGTPPQSIGESRDPRRDTASTRPAVVSPPTAAAPARTGGPLPPTRAAESRRRVCRGSCRKEDCTRTSKARTRRPGGTDPRSMPSARASGAGRIPRPRRRRPPPVRRRPAPGWRQARRPASCSRSRQVRCRPAPRGQRRARGPGLCNRSQQEPQAPRPWRSRIGS
jgi:hypothetical protein